MSRRSVVTAASVVAQAKARAATFEKVIPLIPGVSDSEPGSAVSVLHSRVDESPDLETGAARLRVIIPGKKSPEIYDLTRLLVQPELARFLARGFLYWASSHTVTTRLQNCRLLNFQVSSFLASLDQQTPPAAIDESYWATFIAWLNGARKSNGKPWAHSTRASVLATFKMCIVSLLDHPEHGAVAAALMYKSGFPHNAWPGRGTKQVPTAVLSTAERRAMILACLSDIAALRDRIDEQDAILETGRATLLDACSEGSAPPYETEIGVCAARIAEAFPDRLASFEDVYTLDPTLGQALQYRHGIGSVRRLLYATFRDMVPFVLLIGVKTAFNPDTILSLTWDRIRISDDQETVTFLGVKNRAGGLQVSISRHDASEKREFAAEANVPFGLGDLLELLKRLTGRTRAMLTDPEHDDRVFVGVPLRGTLKVKSYEHSNGPSSDGAWKLPLSEFIRDYGLTPFTLTMLRPSEGEMEWRRTGDLLAVRDRLGHKSATVTRSHYTSGGMRRESQERVAETQALYHRWAQTEGRADPRHQPERCRSAATPGFGCLDPFDSPRPGQRKGRLCTAYGECSDCPLAQAWPEDSQAAAYYLALPKAIHDARIGRISPEQWARKWPPILIAHNRLLLEIPPKVRAEASQFTTRLRPVG